VLNAFCMSGRGHPTPGSQLATPPPGGTPRSPVIDPHSELQGASASFMRWRKAWARKRPAKRWKTSPMAGGRTPPRGVALESAMSVERPMQVAGRWRHGALEDDAYHGGKRLQRVVVVSGLHPSRSHVRASGPQRCPSGAVRMAPLSAAAVGTGMGRDGGGE